MSTTRLNLTPLILLALASTFMPGCSKADAQTSTEVVKNGPRQIELLVYANDFGMVRETRDVDLKQGRVKVGLQDVSKMLDQNSVLFSWPDKTDAQVVSSTYDIGIGNSARLLERFVGKEIDLVYRGDNGKESERITGILQVAEPGNVVVKAGDKFIVNPNATIEASTGSGIVAIPQLSAEIESKANATAKMGVTYLTGGLSWHADYTATLVPGVEAMGLECWATVTNMTGTDFPNASIKFVAGSPNRVLANRSSWGSTTGGGGFATNDLARKERISESFGAPETMGELYAYPYKSTATIKQDQMNRVRMMGADKVTIIRDYNIRLPYIYREGFYGNPDQRLSATLALNFTNDEKSGLGLPLPGGSMRVYEPDKDGNMRYIGAASISDTQKDARVNATLTNVFDLYALAKQTAVKRIDKKTVSRQLEVKLFNEKDTTVELRLVQDFGGIWKITTESEPSTRLSASMAQWKIKLNPGEKKTLSYTVVVG
ncbi:MAG: DUF4139 domain-containing protein [Fimbriimonadaceae bacterium]|nr:DUF4139 domain-containing protein [Fimbriimonadaceae bacterium]